MTPLDEYLDLASRQKWSWGRMDCVQFGLEWAIACAGRPLPAPLAYRTADEAIAFLKAHGGLEAVVTEWMAAHDFEPVSDPDDGDIGVAPLPRADRMSIAGACVVIRRGPWWLGKTMRGFGSVRTEGGIPAWRIV